MQNQSGHNSANFPARTSRLCIDNNYRWWRQQQHNKTKQVKRIVFESESDDDKDEHDELEKVQQKKSVSRKKKKVIFEESLSDEESSLDWSKSCPDLSDDDCFSFIQNATMKVQEKLVNMNVENDVENDVEKEVQAGLGVSDGRARKVPRTAGQTRGRGSTGRREAVSYTHLTLPTILLV